LYTLSGWEDNNETALRDILEWIYEPHNGERVTNDARCTGVIKFRIFMEKQYSGSIRLFPPAN